MTRKKVWTSPEQTQFLLYISIHGSLNWQMQRTDSRVCTTKNFHLSLCFNILLIFIYVLIVCVFVCTRLYTHREEIACVYIHGGQQSTLGVFLYHALIVETWLLIHWNMMQNIFCSVSWSWLQEPEGSSVKRGCICIHSSRYPTGSPLMLTTLAALTQHSRDGWEWTRHWKCQLNQPTKELVWHTD